MIPAQAAMQIFYRIVLNVHQLGIEEAFSAVSAVGYAEHVHISLITVCHARLNHADQPHAERRPKPREITVYSVIVRANDSEYHRRSDKRDNKQKYYRKFFALPLAAEFPARTYVQDLFDGIFLHSMLLSAIFYIVAQNCFCCQYSRKNRALFGARSFLCSM